MPSLFICGAAKGKTAALPKGTPPFPVQWTPTGEPKPLSAGALRMTRALVPPPPASFR